MTEWPKSREVLQRNETWIPGGVVSLNRKCDPNICFVRGQGSRVWDLEGNEYIDYQAAFSAYFLGHADAEVDGAVQSVFKEKRVLMGAGPTDLEGELAELFCRCVPTVEKMQITCTGSEATYHAIRLARAATGRDHMITMQGGYNGWHNDVAGNLMSDLKDVGPRVSPGEYAFDPISAGIPKAHQALIHNVNYNDLDSVRYVLGKYPVAGILLEPLLQNIGIVKPQPGFLEGLRKLADEFGCLLIFDEVKTGFRHGLGGYQGICGVTPDLCSFGKAVANGYPMGVIAGKKRYMDLFTHPDRAKRVLIAGTYNAHPVTNAAAIATLKKLADPKAGVYAHVYKLGQMLEDGVTRIVKELGMPAHLARVGSAFCLYFMDHAPRDYHDLAQNVNFARDKQFRVELIKLGIYQFPLPIKQGSISYAHTTKDIEETLEKMEKVLRGLKA